MKIKCDNSSFDMLERLGFIILLFIYIIYYLIHLN